tara:strand:+ start:445 stop:645 length:201 start_codon:yes stop_codon:yes gene_type:complete
MSATIVLPILLLITVIGIGVVLVVGITSTVNADPIFRNQMMRLRVALQGVAVVIIVLIIILEGMSS